MLAFLQQHSFWSGVALVWVYSAFVSGMPAPDDKDGKGYRWLYNSLHSLAGNITTALGSKIPGLGPK